MGVPLGLYHAGYGEIRNYLFLFPMENKIPEDKAKRTF